LTIPLEDLRRRVLNLESGVSEEVRKRHIAYKLVGNFLGVVPLKTELKLYLAAIVEELTDPEELTRDVRGVGHWATGDTEVRLRSSDQLGAVLALVRQTLDRQLEQGPQEIAYSEAAVEELIEQAGDPDIEQAARAVVEAAVRNNLYPRPWKRSLMFAPPTRRTRALFTLALREDGRVQLSTVPEAFETFFKLDPRDIERQLGPGGWQTLDITELRSLADRIDEVMADVQTLGDPQERRPWNGRDFYVVLGGRDWDDCQRFGFVSAGGGRYYSKPLEQLYRGARVFAYMPGHGYVGVGQVTESVRPVTEFWVDVDGERKPILEAPFSDATLMRDKDDLQRCEYLVRVDWLARRPLDEAVWDTGLFANQMTVCKLRDQVTIDFVLQHLGLSQLKSPVEV
jgi:predicted transport protein